MTHMTHSLWRRVGRRAAPGDRSMPSGCVALLQKRAQPRPGVQGGPVRPALLQCRCDDGLITSSE